MVTVRMVPAKSDIGIRCEVYHRIVVDDARVQCGGVEQVGMDETEATMGLGRVQKPTSSRREVVVRRDAMSGFQQRIDEVRSDEA